MPVAALVLGLAERDSADGRSRARTSSTSTIQSRACAGARLLQQAAGQHLPARRASSAAQRTPEVGVATPYRSRSRHRRPAVVGGAAKPDAAPMIEARGLTKRYGGRNVVNDVSFRCEPGTVTGFLGPNGAGKTTTMRMLVGLSAPDAGDSAVLGHDYHDLPGPGHRVGVLLDASCAAPRPARPRGARGLRADDRRARRARRRAARRSSGSTARPRASACASTRSACASGSGSRTRCSASRRC